MPSFREDLEKHEVLMADDLQRASAEIGRLRQLLAERQAIDAG